MKVAIFIEGEFVPSYSGASNRFHYLSRYLHLNGITEIVAILCDRGWYDPTQISHEPFKTYILNPLNFYSHSGLIIEILKNEGIDILQYANIESAIFQGIPLANLLGKHLIFEAHFDDIEFGTSIGTPQKRIEKIKSLQNYFGKAFDAVTAISVDDKDMLVNHLMIDEERISIIPSGADINELPKLYSNIDSRTLVFLGNLFFQPNIDAIINIKDNIYPILLKDNYKIIVGGDVSETLKIQLEDENFNFIGKVDKVSDLFDGASIGLAPINSGSGMRIKILNYMLAGLPVITTTAGARGFPQKELLIIEDNVLEYPKLVNDLLNSPDWYNHLSQKGREYIVANLSWEIIAARMAEQYFLILDKPCTDKEEFLPFLKLYSQDEPTWLEEAKANGRYIEGSELVKPGQYMTINDGVVELNDFFN